MEGRGSGWSRRSSLRALLTVIQNAAKAKETKLDNPEPSGRETTT
ncbi:MAG: hypothetical protein ABR867_03390 [Nitrososphaerales archaeon]